MPLSAAVADDLLNWLKGTAFPSPPAMLAMSLHTHAVPLANNEVSTQLGGRVAIPASSFSSPGNSVGVQGREIRNVHAIAFGNALTDLSIKSFAIWDAASGGNMLFSGDVIPDVLLKAGDPAVFSTGDLIIRFGPVS